MTDFDNPVKTVTKRNGAIEDFDAIKTIKWGEWSARKLGHRVQWHRIAKNVLQQAYDGIETKKLQNFYINECLRYGDWAHNLMAGGLWAPVLQKELYGDVIPTVKEHHTKLQKLGLMKIMPYSDEEYAEIDKMIDHTRDFDMAHFQIKQNFRKYAIRDMVTDKSYETPQFIFMRMAMEFASKDPVNERLTHVKNFYEEFSRNTINAPTPNYLNAGTKLDGYVSCCLYTTDDDIPSLSVGEHIAYRMTAIGAGIGAFIRSRGLGEPIRGGAIIHNGKTPYYEAQAGSVKANMQSGRAGACTSYYNIFDVEASAIAQLQDPRAPEDKRNRKIHFAVSYHGFFMKKAALNEDIFTFSCKTAPDLFDAFYGKDRELFETLYSRYEQDPTFKKNYVNARDLLVMTEQQGPNIGTHYDFFADNANAHTPFKEKIYSSNLCVAPETKIMTDEGEVQIASVAGQRVNVWNGKEFSNVEITKTGENQKLVTVYTDDENSLTCTPYHKWYVQDDYHGPIREVRTHELQPGMKLIKFDLPTIQGSDVLDKAYQNGFYSADGCEVGDKQRIYFYGQKRGLIDTHFQGMESVYIQPQHNRTYGHYTDLRPKFFVPGVEYRIQSRLNWLAGFVDGDGCIYRNGNNQQLVMTSINQDFLKEVRAMLRTLGVQASLSQHFVGGPRQMPANDGTGETKEYMTSDQWRLIVTSNDLLHLYKLGFRPSRLEITGFVPQRDARRFVRVVGVTDEGRTDDTYCFNEPKRHMGLFNGILTGQCLEIMEVTHPYKDSDQLHKAEYFGIIKFLDGNGQEQTIAQNTLCWFIKDGQADLSTEFPAGELEEGAYIKTIFGEYFVDKILKRDQQPEVALCSLAGIVEPNIRDDAHYEHAMYYAQRMIDYCIHNSSYPFAHIAFTAKKRLNAGIGLLGAATTMARKKLHYDTQEGLNQIHRMAERHMYFAIRSSIRLGKERGNAPWIHKTRWPEGWLPIDTYKREVDDICNEPLHYDWEAERRALIANKGMRFSCLVAHMPTESSSKAAGVPNSWYPIRMLSMAKSDAFNIIDWTATDSDLLGNDYQLAFTIKPRDMIKVYAVIQKFTDQGISADIYVDRSRTLDLSAKELVENVLLMQRLGLKSRYYVNSKTDDAETEKAAACGSEGCTL